jgi:hypothetical protein
MPITPTYPGVYIDELPSSVHTITGVPTSVAAFVGAASRGPTDAPVHTGSFGDFQRTFGGVSSDSPLSYAVYQFYLNGGSDAEVVRLAHSDAVPATLDLGGGGSSWPPSARAPGATPCGRGSTTRPQAGRPPAGTPRRATTSR